MTAPTEDRIQELEDPAELEQLGQQLARHTKLVKPESVIWRMALLAMFLAGSAFVAIIPVINYSRALLPLLPVLGFLLWLGFVIAMAQPLVQLALQFRWLNRIHSSGMAVDLLMIPHGAPIVQGAFESLWRRQLRQVTIPAMVGIAILTVTVMAVFALSMMAGPSYRWQNLHPSAHLILPLAIGMLLFLWIFLLHHLVRLCFFSHPIPFSRAIQTAALLVAAAFAMDSLNLIPSLDAQFLPADRDFDRVPRLGLWLFLAGWLWWAVCLRPLQKCAGDAVHWKLTCASNGWLPWLFAVPTRPPQGEPCIEFQADYLKQLRFPHLGQTGTVLLLTGSWFVAGLLMLLSYLFNRHGLSVLPVVQGLSMLYIGAAAIGAVVMIRVYFPALKTRGRSAEFLELCQRIGVSRSWIFKRWTIDIWGHWALVLACLVLPILALIFSGTAMSPLVFSVQLLLNPPSNQMGLFTSPVYSVILTIAASMMAIRPERLQFWGWTGVLLATGVMGLNLYSILESPPTQSFPLDPNLRLSYLQWSFPLLTVLLGLALRMAISSGRLMALLVLTVPWVCCALAYYVSLKIALTSQLMLLPIYLMGCFTATQREDNQLQSLATEPEKETGDQPV